MYPIPYTNLDLAPSTWYPRKMVLKLVYNIYSRLFIHISPHMDKVTISLFIAFLRSLPTWKKKVVHQSFSLRDQQRKQFSNEKSPIFFPLVTFPLFYMSLPPFSLSPFSLSPFSPFSPLSFLLRFNVFGQSSQIAQKKKEKEKERKL